MSQIMKNSQKVKCKCFISHGDEVNDDDNVNNISFTELKKVLDILKTYPLDISMLTPSETN